MTQQLTSEDAVNVLGNRYDLVLIASIRARELRRGHKPFVHVNHKPIVTALNEIEQGKIGLEYLEKVRSNKR